MNRTRYDVDDGTVSYSTGGNSTGSNSTISNSTAKVDDHTEIKPLIAQDPDPGCCTLF